MTADTPHTTFAAFKEWLLASTTLCRPINKPTDGRLPWVPMAWKLATHDPATAPKLKHLTANLLETTP